MEAIVERKLLAGTNSPPTIQQNVAFHAPDAQVGIEQ